MSHEALALLFLLLFWIVMGGLAWRSIQHLENMQKEQ